jgi:hypothetical protein
MSANAAIVVSSGASGVLVFEILEPIEITLDDPFAPASTSPAYVVFEGVYSSPIGSYTYAPFDGLSDISLTGGSYTGSREAAVTGQSSAVVVKVIVASTRLLNFYSALSVT